MQLRFCLSWARGTGRNAARWPSWSPRRGSRTHGSSRLDIRSVDEFPGAPDVVEDAESFRGNARKKAAEQARALGRWVLADDSGLAVDALQGRQASSRRVMPASPAMTQRITRSCWPQ